MTKPGFVPLKEVLDAKRAVSGHCLYCGVKFTSGRKWKKYCSRKHQEAHWMQNHPRTSKATMPVLRPDPEKDNRCLYCGKEFERVKSFQRFCSDAHQNAYWVAMHPRVSTSK